MYEIIHKVNFTRFVAFHPIYSQIFMVMKLKQIGGYTVLFCEFLLD